MLRICCTAKWLKYWPWSSHLVARPLFLALIVVIGSLSTFGVALAQESKTPGKASSDKASAAQLALKIKLAKSDYLVGEPVAVVFEISNTGKPGADYHYLDRNYDRAGRMPEYALFCTLDGKPVKDPRQNYLFSTMGGLAQSGTLFSGSSFSKSVLLNHWAMLARPGEYKVTGRYTLDNSERTIQSAPVVLRIKARSAQDMHLYIKTLKAQLVSLKQHEQVEPVIQQLAFTMEPTLIDFVIEQMYKRPQEAFWLCETLSFYMPPQASYDAILKVARTRGLAPGMVSALSNIAATTGKPRQDPLSQSEWVSVITPSLAAGNQVCFAEGALAAQNHPDDRFTDRLCAIAMADGGPGQLQAISALAMNRTDKSVKTLKTLLGSKNQGVRDYTHQAIKSARLYRGSSAPGRRLLDDDFGSDK